MARTGAEAREQSVLLLGVAAHTTGRAVCVRAGDLFSLRPIGTWENEELDSGEFIKRADSWKWRARNFSISSS